RHIPPLQLEYARACVMPDLSPLVAANVLAHVCLLNPVPDVRSRSECPRAGILRQLVTSLLLTSEREPHGPPCRPGRSRDGAHRQPLATLDHVRVECDGDAALLCPAATDSGRESANVNQAASRSRATRLGPTAVFRER